jgi:molybdenum cofactor cytidylyltransferase
MTEKIAIIILAAGTSSRLGSPKQLLTFNGKTLLRHAVDAALGTGCQSVFVILGANIEVLREELKDKPITIVENSGWKEGMASSIRCGLENIKNSILNPDSVIFMVCDTCFIS